MDVKQLTHKVVGAFNDRSFRQKPKDLYDPSMVVVDTPTGQELHGLDGFAQYQEGFLTTMPDMKATIVETQASGNKTTCRIRGTGRFTGTFRTPQGDVPGNGKGVDLEYRVEQEFNDAGKLVRFVLSYDAQDLQRQLGLG
jgi:predicted ester cyclase